MFFVILVVLCSITLSTAHPQPFASGGASNLLNNNRTNTTWSFHHKTLSRTSLPILDESLTASLHVSTPLATKASNTSNTNAQLGATTSISTVETSQSEPTTKSSSARISLWKNEAFSSNSTWRYSHQSAQAPSSTSAVWKQLTTAASRGPFLNTTDSNTTWAFSWKNISTSEKSQETEAASSFRFANLAAAAAPVNYPRAVFAHFMVGNVKNWNIDNWKADVQLAKNAHIDGFALNIAYGENKNAESIALAFQAAQFYAFKIIFSFDYAGRGAWPQEDVISLINTYKDNLAHFKRGTQPLVSTFEGPLNASDWKTIKSRTGAFFMPDWSSVGAQEALQLADGVADGLFSWAAWPWGNTDSNTYVDASYEDFLFRAGGKPYMMPVSPWFYTNMPGFDKNWLWRGDDLWRDRWEQVLYVKPDYVQIISWNDYGESHHIGPLRDGTYEAFGKDFGNSPFNYALDLPHDGWRALLPYYIDMYKFNITTISSEVLVAWYRTFPAASVACSDGLTTGNTASQLLLEFSPRVVAQDRIYYSAVMSGKSGTPTVTVTIGGVDLGATWTDIPFDLIGVWHGSVAYGSRVGVVKITINQNNAPVMSLIGKSIAIECTNGLINWNAWTGSSPGRVISATPTLSIDKQVCIEGTAPGNFKGLCEFTCKHGYCPLGACQCLKMGKLLPPPTPSGAAMGYPIAGLGSSYSGLCEFACRAGYCPDTACGRVQVPLTEPTVSPFLPDYCTGGVNNPDKPGYSGLCGYSCGYGFCPMHVCTCKFFGHLTEPPAATSTYKGATVDGTLDHGLCKFACERGYCPDPCDNELDEWWSCDDEVEGDCEEQFPCNYAVGFTNFDQLNMVTAEDEHCKFGHTLTVLLSMLDETIENYKKIDGGYDSAFNHYADAVKDNIQPSLDRFVQPAAYTRGNKYFTCKWKDGSSQPCPINTFEWFGQSWDLEFILNDRAGFFAELLDKYGVLEEWVYFGDYSEFIDRSCPSSPCFPSTRQQYIHGYPLVVDKPKVPNPKEIVELSTSNINALRAQLVTTRQGIIDGSWLGPVDDTIEVLSMPVFMMVQAVDSMRAVKDIGEKAAAEEKRNLIITIVSAILFFLPFAGQAAIAANLVNVGRMIIMIAAAGEAALTIQDVVNNPLLAPLLILDVLSKGNLKTPAQFATQVAKRRAVSPADLGKLGPVYKRQEDALRRTVNTCSR